METPKSLSIFFLTNPKQFSVFKLSFSIYIVSGLTLIVLRVKFFGRYIQKRNNGKSLFHHDTNDPSRIFLLVW